MSSLFDSLSGFPDYSDSRASGKISELQRLMDVTLMGSQYIKAKQAARLMATIIRSYRASAGDPAWSSDAPLAQSVKEGKRFNLVCTAAFDLVSNIEYLHGRLVSKNWIYCHRDDQPNPRVYYSFLKQCPRCCLDRGLGPRIEKAQHKPSSHHIGEITSTISSLVLQLLGAANTDPLTVALITKQSHDADAIAFNSDTLVLFETKASSLATFPVMFEMAEPMYEEGINGDRVEYEQHRLVDGPPAGVPLELFIPHRDLRIPLGASNGENWPYEAAVTWFSEPQNFLRFHSAWLELYYAYRVPKTKRTGRLVVLAYLVNGWGDEIDSNKTKPGLGRTDDLKKGTYQLIKFGAYYRDVDAKLRVRAALVANVDPLFLKAEYIDGVKDIRWGQDADFIASDDKMLFTIDARNLHFLYEGIIAFNDPLINDPLLGELFDFGKTDDALFAGGLDELLNQWANP